MTITKLLLAAAALPGCVWLNARSDQAAGYEGRAIIDGTGRVGGGVHGTAGMAGLYATGELDVRPAHHEGDPNPYTAAGFDVALRASPFGILATEHELERYFDFGAEAGGGGMATGRNGKLDGGGEGFVGAWIELGTAPVGGGYLVVTGSVRRAAMTDGWTDQTLYTIGLGFRTRGPAKPLNLRD